MGELLATISSRELSEWEAFYEIEYEEQLQRNLDARAQAGLNARQRG